MYILNILLSYRIFKWICSHCSQVHLFNVNIPGSTCFKESSTISSGNSLNMFQLGKLKIGLGICYDIRFSEMAAFYRKQGLLFSWIINIIKRSYHYKEFWFKECDMLIYSGSFCTEIGP